MPYFNDSGILLVNKYLTFSNCISKENPYEKYGDKTARRCFNSVLSIEIEFDWCAKKVDALESCLHKLGESFGLFFRMPFTSIYFHICYHSFY
jgi:hypothetical protein